MISSFSVCLKYHWQHTSSPNIYRYIFLICLLLSFTKPAFSQFKQLHVEANENSHIHRVDFYAGAEGYIAFSKMLGFTADSGKTITYKPITNTNVNFNGYTVNLTFGFELSGVKAFDRNRVLIYGNYGLVPAILYSTNGGSTYKVVFHSQFSQIPDSYITDMAFAANNLTGYAVDKHRILKTTDGGLTWVVSFTQENFNFTNLQVLSETVVQAYRANLGGFAPRYATVDGGSNWTLNAIINHGVSCMYFVNNNNVWANTDDGRLLISANSGNTWAQQNDEVLAPVNFSKMIVANDSTAYAIQNVGFDVFKTTNKGKIWERLYRDNSYSYFNYSLNDIQIKGNAIWVGGGHGYLALSGNSGGTVVPRAYFTMDETGATSTGIIKLNNYSKTGNTYKWLVNGKVIGNIYNASYAIDLYGPNDTVKLVVGNKLYTDTLIKVTTFSQAVKITDIQPLAAASGQSVSIYGEHFVNVTSVTFGGVPAASVTASSNGYITAVVGKGASGDVKVSTKKASSTFAGFTYIPPPNILSFLPANAVKDDTVTIKGTGFDWANKVFFNNIEAKFRLVSKSEIRAVVPYGNATGNIIVKSDFNGADTTATVFKLKPVIKSLNNKDGCYNSTVVISGIGFFDVKSVTLDGNAVLSFNVSNSYWNDDEISIQLGEGNKEGKLVITMKNGLTVVYNGFKYHFTPLITSFAPATGSPGTLVTITGNNFSTVAAENFVYFGAVKARVVTATANSIQVKVPIGATYSSLTVATAYATSTSTRYFTPTFNGGGDLSEDLFGAPTNTWAGNNARSFVVVDYNNDGKPDISVSAYGDAGNLNYFVDNKSTPGNISIQRVQSVYISGGSDSYRNGSSHLAVADWDLDGDLDVILAGLNNQKPTYIKSTYNPTNFYGSASVVKTVSGWEADFFYDDRFAPTGIAVSDMDGDGQSDYLVSGSFPQQPFLPNVTLADIDGDGKTDILVHLADTLGVYRNISTKGSATYAPRVDFLAGGTINGITVGDFDNNGKTDVAMTMKSTPGIAVWKNSSTPGNIALVKATSMSTSAVPSAIVAADINGDGKVDIGVSNDGKVLLYQNKSGVSINFGTPVTINLSAPMDLAFADLDGDAKPEIIGLDGTGGEPGINIMRNLTGVPQITSFSPDGGPVGTTVEIRGTDFTGTTSLTIGGTPVRSFKVNSRTSITAVAGEGSKGYIALDGPSGPGTSLSVFHFLTKPAVYVNSYITTEAAVNLGDSVFMSVYPYDEKFKVQWYKDGKAIIKATSPGLSVKNTGNYTASMFYGNDIVTSDPVRLRVILSLPVDNFRLSATSVTCKGSNNGSIAIHANIAINYTATISGGTNRTIKFKSDTRFDDLPPGNYYVCITVDDYPEYQQCFNILVNEPKDLWAYTTVNKTNNTVSLELAGADVYNITVNNKLYTVGGNTTLPLDNGVNKIAISTDKLCQGIIEKLIDLADNIILYPNPVHDVLNVNLGNRTATNASISITGINGGRVLYSKEIANPYGILQVNIADFQLGVYLLRLKLDNKENVYKIIKQ